MGWSVLERMLEPTRERAGLRRPLLGDFRVDVTDGPFIATNQYGKFVPVKRGAKSGTARFAFYPMAVEEEPAQLARLIEFLQADHYEFGNRCSSITEAKARLQSHGLRTYSLVVPFEGVEVVAGDRQADTDQIKMLMNRQGYVACVDGTYVMASEAIPPGMALVAASPEAVGWYTRAGDYMGLLLKRVAHSLMLVVPDDVAR